MLQRPSSGGGKWVTHSQGVLGGRPAKCEKASCPSDREPRTFELLNEGKRRNSRVQIEKLPRLSELQRRRLGTLQTMQEFPYHLLSAVEDSGVGRSFGCHNCMTNCCRNGEELELQPDCQTALLFFLKTLFCHCDVAQNIFMMDGCKYNRIHVASMTQRKPILNFHEGKPCQISFEVANVGQSNMGWVMWGLS